MKVGDKVRVIQTDTSRAFVGAVGTVTRTGGHDDFDVYVNIAEYEYGFNVEELELVEN